MRRFIFKLWIISTLFLVTFLDPQPLFAAISDSQIKSLLTNWLTQNGDINNDAKVNCIDLASEIQTPPSPSPNISPTPSPDGTFFTVQVADESFCLKLTDPQQVRLATDNYFGKNTTHPSGTILSGNGGFNYGFGGLPDDKYWRWWSWRLDPDTTQMVEVSIEVCDGLPSHIEYGILETGGYCPWSAQITALSCPLP